MTEQATILLLGATGMVGAELLRTMLCDRRIRRVVAPTRRALAPHLKLENPLLDFEHLPVEQPWWRADAAICALGTTQGKAGSPEAFFSVDHDLPLALAKIIQFHGTPTFVLTSAVGADPNSSSLYLRTKGLLEQSIEGLNFRALAIARPSLLVGKRAERRTAERLAASTVGFVSPLLPARLRPIKVEALAAALLDAALSSSRGTTSIALNTRSR
jgi:uncharacterized protein YbjT (DUF2867 family)